MTRNEFIDYFETLVPVNRTVRIGRGSSIGSYETIFIDFYNLPEAIVAERQGGGAEAENNRMLFTVRGFDRANPDAPGNDKLQVEFLVSAMPREYKLRKKTAAPEVIARYLADFINRVAREVEPRLTHH